MSEITLRQVEVIRAVMLTGTISGAAKMLHVSAPGISRLVKHTEESLGIRLFERKAGLFVPSVEASRVFDQLREVYRGVENLQTAVNALQKGEVDIIEALGFDQFETVKADPNLQRMGEMTLGDYPGLSWPAEPNALADAVRAQSILPDLMAETVTAGVDPAEAVQRATDRISQIAEELGAFG